MPQQVVGVLEADPLGEERRLPLRARVGPDDDRPQERSSCAPTSTTPIIWPDMATQAMSAGRVPVSSSSVRVASQKAAHQSPGSCSALPPGPKSVG